MIDFKRDKTGVPAKVAAIEYDPNRIARIALLQYADGEKRYILAPDRPRGRRPVIISAASADIKPGNALPLRYIPVGTDDPQRRAARSAAAAQMGRSAGVARAADGQGRRVGASCACRRARCASSTSTAAPRSARSATASTRNIQWGKAGRKRWLGIRPHNRGVAMNPVDHPMGGGEGRSSGGRHPCSPWGHADQGLQDPPQQADGQVSSSRRGK